jgi:hypothetical protein
MRAVSDKQAPAEFLATPRTKTRSQDSSPTACLIVMTDPAVAVNQDNRGQTEEQTKCIGSLRHLLKRTDELPGELVPKNWTGGIGAF